MYTTLEHLVLQHLTGEGPVRNLCCGTCQDAYQVIGIDAVHSLSANEPIAEGSPASRGRMYFVARRAD